MSDHLDALAMATAVLRSAHAAAVAMAKDADELRQEVASAVAFFPQVDN